MNKGFRAANHLLTDLSYRKRVVREYDREQSRIADRILLFKGIIPNRKVNPKIQPYMEALGYK